MKLIKNFLNTSAVIFFRIKDEYDMQSFRALVLF